MSIFKEVVDEIIDVLVPKFRIINNTYLKEIEELKLNNEIGNNYAEQKIIDENYLKNINSIKKEYKKLYSNEINKVKAVKIAGVVGATIASGAIVSVPIVTSGLLISEITKK